MAETEIGSLVVNLKLQTAAFIADIAKSSNAVKANTAKMAKDLSGLRKNFLDVSKVAGGLIAGDFGIAALRRLKDLTAESLNLAEAMGGELGRSAQEVEGKLKSVKEAFEFGIAQGFIDALGKSLDNLSQDKLDALTKAGAALGDALGKALELAAQQAEKVPPAIAAVNEGFNLLANNPIKDWLDKVQEGAFWVAHGIGSDLHDAIAGLIGLDPSKPFVDLDPAIQQFATTVVTADNAVKSYNANWEAMDWQTTVEGVDQVNEALQTNQRIIEQTDGPLDKYRQSLLDIQQAQEQGILAADRAAQAQRMAAALMASSYAGAVGDIASSLTQVFEGNKQVAVASAIINTLEGITKALTLPFPLNWAQVAAVSLAGFAQVRQIEATKPGSGGAGAAASKSSGGASAGAGGGGGGNASAAGPQSSLNLTLVGESGFSRNQLMQIVYGINDLYPDGVRVRVN